MYRGRGRYSGDFRESGFPRARGRGRPDHRPERSSREFGRGERSRDETFAPPKLTGANIDAAADAGAASGRPVRAWGTSTPSAKESAPITVKTEVNVAPDHNDSGSDELEAGEIAPSPPGSPKYRPAASRQPSPPGSLSVAYDAGNQRIKADRDRDLQSARERSPPAYVRPSHQPRYRSPVRSTPRSRYAESTSARGYASMSRARERDWDADPHRDAPELNRDWARSNRSRYSTPSRQDAFTSTETPQRDSRTSRSPASHPHSQNHSRTASRAVSPLDRARARSRERDRGEWDANAQRVRARDRRDRETDWTRERERDRERDDRYEHPSAARNERRSTHDRREERQPAASRSWAAPSHSQRERTPNERGDVSPRTDLNQRRKGRSRSRTREADADRSHEALEADTQAHSSPNYAEREGDREPASARLSPSSRSDQSRPAATKEVLNKNAPQTTAAPPSGPANTFGNVRPPTGPSYRRRMGLPPVSGPRGAHHHPSAGASGGTFQRPADPPARSLARKRDAGGAPLVSDLLPVPNHLQPNQSDVPMYDSNESLDATRAEEHSAQETEQMLAEDGVPTGPSRRDTQHLEEDSYHSHLHQQQASQAEHSVGQPLESTLVEHARQDSAASASQGSMHTRQYTGSQSQQGRPGMAPPAGLSRLSFSQLNPITTSHSSTPGGRATPGGAFSNVTPNTPAVPGTPFAYGARTPAISRGGSLSGPPTGPAAALADGATPTGPASRSHSQSQQPSGLGGNGLAIPTAALAQQLYPAMDPNLALELLSIQTSRLTSIFGLHSARANLRASLRDVKDADRELEAASLKRDITMEALEKARNGAEMASVEEERREVERRRGQERGLFV